MHKQRGPALSSLALLLPRSLSPSFPPPLIHSLASHQEVFHCTQAVEYLSEREREGGGAYRLIEKEAGKAHSDEQAVGEGEREVYVCLYVFFY